MLTKGIKLAADQYRGGNQQSKGESNIAQPHVMMVTGARNEDSLAPEREQA
jgi:hypothetical protein